MKDYKSGDWLEYFWEYFLLDDRERELDRTVLVSIIWDMAKEEIHPLPLIFSQVRAKARRSKEFKIADAIRDKIKEWGYEIEDRDGEFTIKKTFKKLYD